VISILAIAFISCGDNLNREIIKRIQIFERNEAEHFNEVSLQILRQSRNHELAEFEMRYKSKFGYARIQTFPKQIIFENFPNEPIDTLVLKVIDSLKISGLYNYGTETQLEFWDKNEYVILYRNSPYKRKKIWKTKSIVKVEANWNYFKFDLKTN